MIRRLAKLFVYVMATVVCLSGCQHALFPSSALLLGYRGEGTANEITIVYLTGEAATTGDAEVLAQDANVVRLRVLFYRANGQQNSAAIRREVRVKLEAPLGDRSVLNEAGEEVQRCGPGVDC